MLRIGLILYLMLAMLAGPALCCCLAERLTAEFARPAEQESSGSCACRKHQSQPQSQYRAPEQRPDKQDRPHRSPCPCQEHRSQETALVSQDSNLAQQLQSRQLLQGPIELLTIPPTALCLSSYGDSDLPRERAVLPFLTAQDLLRALHMLRC